jgi:glycosyltransferase involved in cell wall biosynthesis
VKIGNEYSQHTMLSKNGSPIQIQASIAFVAHSFEHGGAQNYLYDFVKYCRGEGIECLVIGPKTGPQAEDFRNLGAKVVRISLTSIMGGNVLWRPKQFLKIALNTVQMMRVFSRFQPTLVYTNTSVIISGALASRILKVDHFWHVHENFDTMKFPSALGVKWLGKILTDLSVKVIFPSRLARNSLFPPGCKKTVIIQNGVDLSRFRVPSVTGTNVTNPRICFVGSLEHRKGVDVLLKALAVLIHERRARVSLDIWGRGDLESSVSLQSQVRALGVEEDVRFMGCSNNMEEILPDYGALVVPSRGESFSLVTVEAMASGVPVVATRCGGPEEVIDDGISGILVDVGDYRGLAESIEKILDHPAYARMLAVEARNKAVRCFDAERQYRKIIDCIVPTDRRLFKEVSPKGDVGAN